MSGTQWIKSSYSDPQGGNCVEWAPGRVSGSGVVPVRDSKETGRSLSFSPAAWRVFIEGVKRSV
ncbi:DUF397 domain-containing protein [Streptomyces oryzae]|nr:DUF397 domain-containing protein [Streptomyces oryzae]